MLVLLTDTHATVEGGLASDKTHLFAGGDVSVVLDISTGLVTWTFTTIDPATGQIPADGLTWFLPPNNDAGDGIV